MKSMSKWMLLTSSAAAVLALTGCGQAQTDTTTQTQAQAHTNASDTAKTGQTNQGDPAQQPGAMKGARMDQTQIMELVAQYAPELTERFNQAFAKREANKPEMPADAKLGDGSQQGTPPQQNGTPPKGGRQGHANLNQQLQEAVAAKDQASIKELLTQLLEQMENMPQKPQDSQQQSSAS
ncbi:hypothetical protein [Brevibacillus fulvus]|uniref:Lipoprotein n=1 Tax=Brevibacillus fulvus TaxID=1125967 RepID=A0A939BVJ5_9BACL|nr:hypothetical protein [Brevibacillus fulvus]MBM7591529.1 hypothetical protein [Brevibacillus fulvus]